MFNQERPTPTSDEKKLLVAKLLIHIRETVDKTDETTSKIGKEVAPQTPTPPSEPDVPRNDSA